MPFSFTPDVKPAEGNAVQAAPGASMQSSIVSSVPPSAFGSSSVSHAPVANLMERAQAQGKSIVDILAFVSASCAILAVIGLFGYKYYLSSQVDIKKDQLAQYESQLAALPLEDMRNLSNRLKVINQLIKEHPSVNVAFLIVEASVENMVTFSKFDLHYSDASKSYQLSLGGVAPDYKSVAQQVDTYKRKPYSTYIPKVTVDNLQPDSQGQIAVSFSMPITIQGFIPETFSIVDGTTAPIAPPAVVATTTPSENPGNVIGTAPVEKP